MYLASLKQTVRLYPIVLGVIIVAMFEELFPQVPVIANLSLITLLIVLRYRAYSRYLPVDLLMPLSFRRKIVSFILRSLVLSVLGVIPVGLLITVLPIIYPDFLDYSDASAANIGFTALTLIVFGLSNSFVLAKFGLLLPASIAGYVGENEKELTRSDIDLRETFYKLLFGPSLLFCAAYLPTILGYLVSYFVDLKTIEGTFSVWFSVPDSVFYFGLVCWAEVMIAGILSALFVKVRTVPVNGAPATSTPTTTI